MTKIEEAARELEHAEPQEILRWAYAAFDRIAIVASFQVDSSVLIDLASGIASQVDVATLDTGRLPQETFEVAEELRRRYGFRLHVGLPDPAEVAKLTAAHGLNPFYQSVELRHTCCDLRKTRPLDRLLVAFDAWTTGLRRDQGGARAATPVVAEDPTRPGTAKLAPLANWTRDQVWDYVAAHRIPTHPLYAKGFPSIGCAPCTRAIGPGEGERAGRWWWEQDTVKECGLHWSPEGTLTRR
ncbi:MAG: phosphoadenylyl-sulfate reductase [Candidatus Dormibacteraceae bacterium]